MLNNFEAWPTLGKDGVEATAQSFAAATKGAQAIAVEYADYARKSFEQGTTALEKLAGARTFDRALEVQSEYARTAYEGFVTQATRIGELYADVAKQAYKPIEGYAAKIKPAA